MGAADAKLVYISESTFPLSHKPKGKNERKKKVVKKKKKKKKRKKEKEK